jgi:hypothetical protein
LTLAHKLDHEAEGLDTLIYDLRTPKLQALLSTYLVEVQQAEDALWILYICSMIPDAFGAALDQLGGLVDQKRENRTDDVYRLWILAKALVLRSSGRPEELIAIARMVLPETVRVQIVDEYPAALSVRLIGAVDPDTGSALATLLRSAKAISVRLLTTWRTTSTPFRYPADGIAQNPSANGYGAGHYAFEG